MCSIIVLMLSVRIYNSHENKEKALNEKVCANFDGSLGQLTIACPQGNPTAAHNIN